MYEIYDINEIYEIRGCAAAVIKFDVVTITGPMSQNPHRKESRRRFFAVPGTNGR